MEENKQKHSSLRTWKSVKFQSQKNLLSLFNKITGRSVKSKRKPTKESAKVIVGPVIGKVTSTTARILIETDRDVKVSVCLDSSTSLARKHIIMKKDVVGMRPTVFEFTNLDPGTRYQLQLKGCMSRVDSSFSTFLKEGSGIVNVAAISCNKIYNTQQAIPIYSDLWAHLDKSIGSGKVDLILHLGDQIYGDGDELIDAAAGSDRDKWSDRFRIAKHLMSKIPKEQWKNHEEEICEKYREVYRETWQHPPTAKCLANCPNLMIYDDHEVRDNWGDLEKDWDSDTLDFFIARCAWIVTLEYQRQLHENVDFSKLEQINKDYHFHVIGGLAIMFLDIRGSRTFHRAKPDERPYLGSSQWSDIANSLGCGGLFDSVRVLLVCSPAPLVFLETTITNAAAKNVGRLEDFKGHWSAKTHIKEQIEMIECLWKWKSSSDNRELLVLGGDVHCGGHSRILRHNKVLFCQLTTSPIANMPLPKRAYYIMRAAGRFGKLNSGYDFKHLHWTRSRNYGLVEIKNYREQDNAPVEITSQLVKGKFLRGIRMGVKVTNSPVQKTHCCYGA